ncbi:MAG: hypothetical protein OXG81_08095 [Acidobacteria bacterium]|nr:hypothetical protein [Acidobacteriota bacterium]
MPARSVKRPPATPTCAELAGDLIGAVQSGHRDLATKSDLLEQAVAADAQRATGIASTSRASALCSDASACPPNDPS